MQDPTGVRVSGFEGGLGFRVGGGLGYCADMEVSKPTLHRTEEANPCNSHVVAHSPLEFRVQDWVS